LNEKAASYSSEFDTRKLSEVINTLSIINPSAGSLSAAMKFSDGSELGHGGGGGNMNSAGSGFEDFALPGGFNLFGVAGKPMGASINIMRKPSVSTMTPSNANAQKALSSKLSNLESAQINAAKTKTLSDGRVRYYRDEIPSSKPGLTRGASYVTEWNPKTGQLRSWYENYDHSGNVIRVHPKNSNGIELSSPHFPKTGKELKP
jgi:hypothetical protein